MEKHEFKLQLSEDQVDQLLLGLTLREIELRRQLGYCEQNHLSPVSTYRKILQDIGDIKRQIIEDNREPSLWIGATARGHSIIGKILAQNETEARAEVHRQLSKPGRRVALAYWLGQGAIVLRVR